MKGSKGGNAERTALFCLSLKIDGTITSNPTQYMREREREREREEEIVLEPSTKFARKNVKSDTATVIKLVVLKTLFVLPAVFGKIDFSFKDILLNTFFK